MLFFNAIARKMVKGECVLKTFANEHRSLEFARDLPEPVSRCAPENPCAERIGPRPLHDNRADAQAATSSNAWDQEARPSLRWRSRCSYKFRSTMQALACVPFYQRRNATHRNDGFRGAHEDVVVVVEGLIPMFILTFSNFWIMFGKLWETCSRLYRNRFLQLYSMWF